MFKRTLLLLLPLAIATGLSAQTPAPYSSFALRIARLQPVSIGALSPFYEAEPGGSVELATPFEAGSLGLTFGWMALRGKPGALSGAVNDRKVIPARVVGLNWRFPALHRSRFRASAGVRVSTFRVHLPDSLISRNDRTEDELSVGLLTQLEYAPVRRVSVMVGGDVARVWANVPWRLTTLSAGLSLQTAMPERVRRWLR